MLGPARHTQEPASPAGALWSNWRRAAIFQKLSRTQKPKRGFGAWALRILHLQQTTNILPRLADSMNPPQEHGIRPITSNCPAKTRSSDPSFDRGCYRNSPDSNGVNLSPTCINPAKGTHVPAQCASPQETVPRPGSVARVPIRWRLSVQTRG